MALVTGFESWLAQPGSPQRAALEAARQKDLSGTAAAGISDPVVRMMYEELQRDPRGLAGSGMADLAAYRNNPQSEPKTTGEKSELGRWLFAITSPQSLEVQRLRKEWMGSRTDEPDAAHRMMVHRMDSEADQRSADAEMQAQRMAEMAARERARKAEEEGLMGLPGYQQKMRKITGGN